MGGDLARGHDGEADPGRRTRVVLVEDHPVVRAGVRAIVESAGPYVVVGEADEAGAAVELVTRERPDLVVLDLSLRGGSSGLDILPALKAAGARVIVLSVQDEPAYARRAFQRGAQAYVVKDAADDELALAIEHALVDRFYVNPRLAARLVLLPADDHLTERQREIARLLALGYTNQQVASELYLSVRTVEAHRRHIMRTLQLASRAELVRYAIDNRLVRFSA